MSGLFFRTMICDAVMLENKLGSPIYSLGQTDACWDETGWEEIPRYICLFDFELTLMDYESTIFFFYPGLDLVLILVHTS